MTLARGAVAFAVASLAACATPGATDAPKRVSGQPLEAYGEHEECATLAAGDRIEYAFSTNAPVDFNIHYHDGAAIVSPITREHVSADSDVFAALIAQNYCLMWEAGAPGAILDYQVRILRAPR